jgi:hypothetical protein
MEDYVMQENEVELYRNSVGLRSIRNSDIPMKELHLGNHTLILTNVNVVLITKIKKMFKPEEVYITTDAVSNIKMYEGIPQVKQEDDEVKIFFTDQEMTVSFDTKSEARKFVAAAYELLTGQKATERGATKVKGAIGLVDSTLGIDTVGAVKGVMENGVVGSLFSGINKKKANNTSNVAGTVTDIVGAAKDMFGKKPTNAVEAPKQPEMTIDEQIEAVKKLKDLLDAGILSQEEFDAKKKQIMKL